MSNIYAIGRNYATHAAELGHECPEEPVVFGKHAACLTRASQVRLPAELMPIHFELELVLSLGADVAVGALVDLGCVAEIGLGVDFTARGLQSQLKSKGLPWFLAKNFNDSAFLGPLKPISGFLSESIRFQLYQNGELKQDGDSRHMLFDFERLLTFLNRRLPLQRGDLIYTGTPAGVGPVADGDVLKVVSETLGLDSEIQVQLASF